MLPERPFFSASLLVTAPDGTYGGLRKSQHVAAYEDRLEINGVRIGYAYLAALRAFGNVLHVAYVASDGRRVEQYFRYNTFLAKTGATELAEMVQRVAAAKTALDRAAAWKSEAPPVKKPLQAEMLPPADNGWQPVAVYSSFLAFPAVCPVCVRAAEAMVAMRPLLGASGAWLVPVCEAHQDEASKYLTIYNWEASKARSELLAWNRDYAKELLIVNSGDDPERVKRQANASPLLVDIRNGVRLVQFQYVYALIALSVMVPSKVHVIRPEESGHSLAWKYSLLTALTGWWSFVGPFWTIACIIRNFRGGIDLTDTAAAVLSGTAMATGGYR